MTDERPDSLAAQAASWVPPWERAPREPDRAYQAAAASPDISDDAEDVDDPGTDEESASADEAGDFAADGGASADEADFAIDGGASADEAGDFAADGGASATRADAAVADAPVADGDNFAEPAATVDEPAGLPGKADEPADAGLGPDLPVPAPVEEAVEAAGDDDGEPVDAPRPTDGDDAADVFDRAADDDEADADLPLAEDAPEDEPRSASATDDFHGGAAIPAQGRSGRDFAAAAGEQETRTPDGPDGDPGPERLDDAELRAALEAILLVVDEPVGEMYLAQILEQPTERVAAMLEDISARYTAAGHGFDLRRAAGGWRLYTRPEYAGYVERFVLDGQSVRLTQAALETLAVVAYKQPVTRSRISAIRGVNCDGVMRTLTTRGLIEECGIEPETGAHLYRTTGLFLEKLGLNSVDQLPPLAPFLPDDVEEVLDASG